MLKTIHNQYEQRVNCHISEGVSQVLIPLRWLIQTRSEVACQLTGLPSFQQLWPVQFRRPAGEGRAPTLEAIQGCHHFRDSALRVLAVKHHQVSAFAHLHAIVIAPHQARGADVGGGKLLLDSCHLCNRFVDAVIRGALKELQAAFGVPLPANLDMLAGAKLHSAARAVIISKHARMSSRLPT